MNVPQTDDGPSHHIGGSSAPSLDVTNVALCSRNILASVRAALAFGAADPPIFLVSWLPNSTRSRRAAGQVLSSQAARSLSGSAMPVPSGLRQEL